MRFSFKVRPNARNNQEICEKWLMVSKSLKYCLFEKKREKVKRWLSLTVVLHIHSFCSSDRKEEKKQDNSPVKDKNLKLLPLFSVLFENIHSS